MSDGFATEPLAYAAATVAEHEHEVGRGGDEAPEVRGLPPRRRDERHAEKHRHDRCRRPERELELTEPATFASVWAAMLRAAFSETFDVSARDRAQALDVVPRRDVLVPREPHTGQRPSREIRAAGSSQVVRSTAPPA